MSDIGNNMKNNPSEFWKFVRTKQNVTRIPSFLKDDNNMYSFPQKTVNAFAYYFSPFYQNSHLSTMSEEFSNHRPFTFSKILEKDRITILSHYLRLLIFLSPLILSLVVGKIL